MSVFRLSVSRDCLHSLHFSQYYLLNLKSLVFVAKKRFPSFFSLSFILPS